MSGSGKTTLALGLMAALTKRGFSVAPFKVGPDFIDPGHHARVTGRPSRNLDGWMLTEAYNQRCFANASKETDIAVVEGVMGLFDGYDGGDEAGSTAQIARMLGLRVVLVVDAARMARSAAALVQGFENFDRDLEFAGVIFNNLGSRGHLHHVVAALAGHVRMPCLGGLLKNNRVSIPERHLGLVTEDEYALTGERVTALAKMVESHVDIDGLLDRLEDRPPGPVESCEKAPGTRVKIGVARDRAFCFYYQDNLDLLEKAGAEIVFFSPMGDDGLPPGINGLYLGGGYPELFADLLSGNRNVMEQIGEESRRGMPIYAECGGFMYLCDTLTDLNGSTFPMAGCFPLQAKMSPKLKALGYREICLNSNTILGPRGLVIRGHEFHYSDINGDLGKLNSSFYKVTNVPAGVEAAGGFEIENTLGSYHHLHFGSCPAAARGFVAACDRFARSGAVHASD